MARRTDAAPPLEATLTRGAASSSWRVPAILVGVLAGIGILARVFNPTQVAWAQNFFLVFSSLLIEAIPFVLLGAVVSALMETVVPSRVFERLTRLPRSIQVPAAGLAGLTFPVCECGSVPVARRLALKGFAPSAAVTFMLAAPIVNPVVIISTFVAYRGREALWLMVVGRVLLGIVVAVVAGWVAGGWSGRELLRGRRGDGADHRHEEEHRRASGGRWSKLNDFVDHLVGDFLFMGRYLILGVLFAAAFQTFVPTGFANTLADVPILNLVAMMGLAFLLSLCSESDAFVGASFVQFGPAAQLAFLVFGPIVDMKLVMLYRGTFTRGFVSRIVITVAAVTLAATLWLEIAFG